MFSTATVLLTAAVLFTATVILAGCAPAASMPTAPAAAAPSAAHPTAAAEVPSESAARPTLPSPSAPTSAPAVVETPPAIITPAPTLAQPTSALLPTPTPALEARLAEIEWPPRLRLGESDVVRLSLIPSSEGYTLKTEYPEHQGQSQTVRVPRPGGYDLYGVARLDGVGFTIAPEGDQAVYIPPDETVTWRWSLTSRQPGQQRLSVSLRLRWVPVAASNPVVREAIVYSQTLDVRVVSFLGLTQPQALAAGLFGLFFGGGLSLWALVTRARPPRPAYQAVRPNPALEIERRPGLALNQQETSLLQAMFERYSRLIIDSEFLSGYSGARTFLAQPIRRDGRADAYTIAKLGPSGDIQREFENYETYVKDTLPPVTARIQHAPVVTQPYGPRRKAALEGSTLAALQYTFIGEPGSRPTSLRQALLADPQPALLNKLFETFGPNWWMQRRPYTFCLGLEYDRQLPTHLILEPASTGPVKSTRPVKNAGSSGGTGRVLDGRTPPGEVHLSAGEIVSLRNFTQPRLRADAQSLALQGTASPGQPPLRVRWLSPNLPARPCGRVVATRLDILCSLIGDAERFGLPDPLPRLPELLAESISGSLSTIHGDLNLENVLVGPGNFVWLIDFAQTRDGHTLFDFAHLQAQLIAHVLAQRVTSPVDYLAFLDNRPVPALAGHHALLLTLREITQRCLFNPVQPREFNLALYVTCLGSLKHANLGETARRLLYLTAAHQVQKL